MQNFCLIISTLKKEKKWVQGNQLGLKLMSGKHKTDCPVSQDVSINLVHNQTYILTLQCLNYWSRQTKLLIKKFAFNFFFEILQNSTVQFKSHTFMKKVSSDI